MSFGFLLIKGNLLFTCTSSLNGRFCFSKESSSLSESEKGCRTTHKSWLFSGGEKKQQLVFSGVGVWQTEFENKTKIATLFMKSFL